MAAKYQVPLRDGKGGMMDVTVKGLRVIDANGKDLGPVKMFPGLKRVSENTGSFFDGAKGGKYDTETEETPEVTETPEVRTSPTGIQQTGKKLGIGDINGLFASLNERGQMTSGELPSASKFFSEALPTTKEGATQLGHGSLVTGPDGKPMEMETDAWNDETGRLEPASVPGVIGGKPESAEDGTSAKPDVADQIRQVRMHRNKRDQLEGFSMDTPIGGESETKGDGMTASRRAARSAFLDEGNKGYAAIRARDRAVGAFHQYDQGGMKIGDDIHMFNEGMSKDARFALSGNGIKSKDDAQDFLNTYVQGFNKPEKPAEEDK